MALKAVHVSDVPNLDHVPDNAALNFYTTATAFSKGVEVGRNSFKAPKFMVLGHRGNGMNRLQSSDRRMKDVKENTILSFNTAAQFPIDFVEFDVQVTKDGYPVIFHDNFIVSQENGTIFEKRVTELNLCEFLAYGPQKQIEISEKPLMRKLKDGRIMSWNVETDDTLCTLQDAFEYVEPRLGFDIELKFDDHLVYDHDHLRSLLHSIVNVVYQYAKDRPIIFSSFQPDAALLIRKLQGTYPVFFLTNGGTELYHDVRRNSLEEAMKLALQGGLQGIVSEVKGIFQNPGAVNKIKESKLSLLSYGQLNNVSEAVYIQHLMGIDGVVVDYVKDITEDLNNLIKPVTKGGQGVEGEEGAASTADGGEQVEMKPQFSQRELAFLLKLIPQLIQH